MPSSSAGSPPPQEPCPSPGGGASELVRSIVLENGFHRVGIARAGPAPSGARLGDWLRKGFAGQMGYMERTEAKRRDPRLVLEGARSVIVAALHYKSGAGDELRGSEALVDRLHATVEDVPRGRIAAYAQGTDYHEVMEKRLRGASEVLAQRLGGQHRYYVDTGPVLERDWAAEAGIGWIGKNTCSINPRHGSYFLIGVILSTLELTPDAPAENHCGTCRLCLDACPTGAFNGPYELDSRRCISYLTIEHRGPIDDSQLSDGIGEWIFGCDICQDVCPFNQKSVSPVDALLKPREENVRPSLTELAGLDLEAFRARFRKSPVRRARWEGLQRNVALALGNASVLGSGALEALGSLQRSPLARENPGARSAIDRAEKRLTRKD